MELMTDTEHGKHPKHDSLGASRSATTTTTTYTHGENSAQPMTTRPAKRGKEATTLKHAVEGYDANSIHWKFINPDGTPDEKMLARITKSIIKTLNPRKIVLFGSAARGQMNEHSDLDILVITDDCDTDAATTELYCQLPSDRRGADIVVVTTTEVERNRRKPYFVIEPALREGRVLHEH